MSLRSEITRAISDARDRAIASGALLEVAADTLGLVDFGADQALELRLAKDR